MESRPTLVDAQRDALRDLVSLATESAATEARIDRELKVALAKAAETFEASTATIDQKFNALAAQAKQKHAAALAEAARRQAAAEAAIRQFEEPARREAQGAFDQTRQLVEKKIGEATWLAESDWEVTTNTLAAEKKKIEATVAADVAQLDAGHRQALQKAVQFGYRPAAEQLAQDADPQAADSTAAASTADFAAEFETRRQEMQSAATELGALVMPQLFVGVMPVVVVVVSAAMAGAAAWLATGFEPPNLTAIGAAAGGAGLLTIIVGVWLRSVSRRHVEAAYGRVTSAERAARVAAANRLVQAAAAREAARARAAHKREGETKFATEKYSPATVNARKKLDATLAAIMAKSASARSQADADNTALLAEIHSKNAAIDKQIDTQRALDHQGARLFHERQQNEAKAKYAQERSALEARLRDGLATIAAPIDASAAAAGQTAPADWESGEWASWKPATTFAPAVRVGSLHVNLLKIASAASSTPKKKPKRPAPAQSDFEHPRITTRSPPSAWPRTKKNPKSKSPSARRPRFGWRCRRLLSCRRRWRFPRGRRCSCRPTVTAGPTPSAPFRWP